MADADQFRTDAEVQWCPGCPNFSILKAFCSAMERLEVEPHRMCLVSGIGQVAKPPTTPRGEPRSIQFQGTEADPLNPLGIAVLHGCTFVARGFAADPDHLTDLLVQAIEYPGFSVVDVIQPCISWDPHPVGWYKERVVKLGDDHDPGDPEAALARTRQWGDRLPIGVFYRSNPRPTFGSRFREEISDRPLAELPPLGAEAIGEIFASFRP